MNSSIPFFTHLLSTILIVLTFSSSCMGFCRIIKEKVFSEKISKTNKKEFDDWVDLPECHILGDKRCEKLCRGYYIEPEFPYIEGDQDQLPTEITADEGKILRKGTSVFKGNVITKKGNQEIRSELAEVTHKKEDGELEKIYAKGNIKIIEPGSRIDGSEALYFSETDEKIVKNANFRIYDSHARGTSPELRKKGEFLTFLPNATYTTCAPKTNIWTLKAKKIKLDKESGRGEAWRAILYTKDLPVFFWPYVNFPIDDRRKTGFLMPSYLQSDSFGHTIITPYYVNMAANYDATITPYMSSKRNFRFLNEFRYLTNRSNGIIMFDFLPNDEEYVNYRKEKLQEEKFKTKEKASIKKIRALKDIKQRHAYSIKHYTVFNKNLSFNLNYARVEDDNFIRDIGTQFLHAEQMTNTDLLAIDAIQPSFFNTSTFNTTNALLQKATLVYKNDLGNLTSIAQKYQALHPFESRGGSEQYQKLPEINFNSNVFDISKAKFNFKTIYTQFKIKREPPKERRTYGKRFYIKPVISFPITDAGWFVKPSVKMHHVSYDLNLNTVDKKKHHIHKKSQKTIPIYELDNGLIFEKDLKIDNKNYLQTLEPRAYFLYVPYQNQDHLPRFDSGAYVFEYDKIFRDNRYGGFDRQSEAKQLSLGVSSKILTASNNREKAIFSIGQILYFQDRIKQKRIFENINNKTKFSPIAFKVKYNIFNNFNLINNLVWDHYNKNINLGTLLLQYKPKKYNIVNIGYTFYRHFPTNPKNAIDPVTKRKKHMNQVNISSTWFLSRHIRILGRIEYDIQRKNPINILAGFEHYGCCTNFRAVITRNRVKLKTRTKPRVYETAVGLQIILKGFAGGGTMQRSILSSNILGYDAPRDNEF